MGPLNKQGDRTALGAIQPLEADIKIRHFCRPESGEW
jgi:hypothetical protein